MWGSILTLAVQVVGWLIMRDQNNVEAQRRFFTFVDGLRRDGLVSVKLVQSYKAQKDRLRERRKELKEVPIEKS